MDFTLINDCFSTLILIKARDTTYIAARLTSDDIISTLLLTLLVLQFYNILI